MSGVLPVIINVVVAVLFIHFWMTCFVFMLCLSTFLKKLTMDDVFFNMTIVGLFKLAAMAKFTLVDYLLLLCPVANYRSFYKFNKWLSLNVSDQDLAFKLTFLGFFYYPVLAFRINENC